MQGKRGGGESYFPSGTHWGEKKGREHHPKKGKKGRYRSGLVQAKGVCAKDFDGGKGGAYSGGKIPVSRYAHGEKKQRAPQARNRKEKGRRELSSKKKKKSKPE